MKQKGFTLIELLVALSIFTLLMTITSGVLIQAFQTQARVNTMEECLNKLQLAISIIQHTTEKILPTPPSLQGNRSQVTFRYAALINDNNQISVKKISFLCRQKQLILRRITFIDPLHGDQYQDKTLLDNLSDCEFGYLDDQLDIKPSANDSIATKSHSGLPKALFLKLKLANLGQGSFLFRFPPG